ncbi:MAG: glycosyltransferase, partial [Nocardioides sp.]
MSDSFAGDFDERAQAARHLVDAWIDAGHAPTVLTASAGTNSYRGADVWRVRGLRGRGKRLRSALLQVAPDVVVALSPDEFGRKALKQAVRLGLATVVIEQRPVPSYLPEYYHEQVIGRADRLVVTTDWVRARLAERGVAAQVWRPGVDLTAYHPELRDPTLHRHWTKGTKLAVGYAGELRKREGVRRLAGLSSIPFVQPVFIGAGPQRTWLRTNASGVFTNPRDTGALGTALASLDVLVHPSRRLTDAP